MCERRRLLKPPESHFFLWGPRGTGKSQWTRQVFPKALRIDLLDEVDYMEYALRPARLRDRIAAVPDVATVVIDEVQKVPALLDMAHLLISEGVAYQFVFTSSSTRKLRRGNANLLGGRALLRSMHPYVASELGADFDIDKAIHTGMVPVVVENAERVDAIKAYAALYVKEEVFVEGLVRNVPNFSRFLEAISYSQGSTLNASNVARDCGVSRTSVENYIDILEDLMLAFRLPVFAKRPRRNLVAHDKFYFFDAGVYRANRPSGPLDDPGPIDGIALETLVVQHLRAFCDYDQKDTKLYYWRTQTGIEVDFVLYGPSEFTAIEVKNSAVVKPADLRGLRAFMADYPECKVLFLYRGKERLLRDGILIMPLQEWFASDHTVTSSAL